MPILKHYPKCFLLTVSCVPFLLAGTGISVIAFSGMSWYYILGIILIFAGLKFPVVKINSLVIHTLFKTTLEDLQDSDWIALFIENSSTSNKLKLVPDDIALLYKKNNKFFILNSQQISQQLPVTNLQFKNNASSDLFCSISCLNEHGQENFDFLISPLYKGEDFYIASSGSKRFEWFMDWLGCSVKNLNNSPSQDEIMHHS